MLSTAYFHKLRRGQGHIRQCQPPFDFVLTEHAWLKSNCSVPPYLEISSSTLPFVSTPSIPTAKAAVTKAIAPIVNTPAVPNTGIITATKYGPITEPIRPTPEAKPQPVARARVGYNSGVQVYQTMPLLVQTPLIELLCIQHSAIRHQSN